MVKILTLIMVLTAVGMTPSHSSAEAPVSPHQSQAPSFSVHEKGTAKKGTKATMIDVLKQQRLANYPSKTIGEAFDRYDHFAKKEWQETHAKGKTYIDFTGWFPRQVFDMKGVREGTVSEGLAVKFVISPDGTYGVVMISRQILKSDGKVLSYPQTDISRFLNSIYGNKKIDINR